MQPLVLVAAFGFELLLLVGPTLILASLNPFFRDLAQILPPVLMIAFYVHADPLSRVDVPATGRRRSSRSTRCATSSRSSARRSSGCRRLRWRRLGIETAAFIVLGFAGRQFYRRLRPAFADVL